MTGDQGQPGYRGSLQPNCVTFAQVLKTAGYRTAMVGKWHVGDNVSPIDRGFDDFYGWTKRLCGRFLGAADDDPPARRAAQRTYPATGEFFATDALTDHALDFLAEMRGRDCALASLRRLSSTAFSAPVAGGRRSRICRSCIARGWDQAPRRAARAAKEAGTCTRRNKCHAAQPPSRIPPWPNDSARRRPTATTRPGTRCLPSGEPIWRARMAVYAGMVSGMDRNIGRLIADCVRSGEIENTLILFLSDNGACAEWEPFGFDLEPVKNHAAGRWDQSGHAGGAERSAHRR